MWRVVRFGAASSRRAPAVLKSVSCRSIIPTFSVHKSKVESLSRRFCSSSPSENQNSDVNNAEECGEATANFSGSKAVQFLKGCFTGDENVGMFRQDGADGNSQLVLSFDVSEVLSIGTKMRNWFATQICLRVCRKLVMTDQVPEFGVKNFHTAVEKGATMAFNALVAAARERDASSLETALEKSLFEQISEQFKGLASEKVLFEGDFEVHDATVKHAMVLMGGQRGDRVHESDLILSAGQYAILRGEDKSGNFGPHIFPMILNRGVTLICDVRVRVKQSMKFRSECKDGVSENASEIDGNGFLDPRSHMLRFERVLRPVDTSIGRFEASSWMLTDVNMIMEGNFPFEMDD